MEKRQQAVAFFIGRGWSAEQASGIVANLEAESGLRPDAVGDGGKAYGIAQWHPDRQANFAAIIGKSIHGSSLEDQMFFVHAELQRWEKHAGDALAVCKTAADAGACVSRLYERPADTEGEAAKRGALAERIFAELGNNSEPVADNKPATAAPPPQPETSMGALALLQLFGPILSGMIPQISPLLKPATGDKFNKYAGIAQVVLDTINKTTGQPNLQGSLEAMQADPAVKTAVQQAVVSHPDVIESLTIGEVGGGVVAARAADLASRSAPDGPFWKSSAVFYVSLLLVPMVLWYVGSSIAGGIDIPSDWPWYAQMPLKLLGKEWDDGARVGLANLVVGMVLGGICGVYFGVSVTQAKQTQQAADSKP